MSSIHRSQNNAKSYTVLLLGDIMIGRLIDQLLPTHVDEPDEARIVNNFLSHNPHLKEYSYDSPLSNAVTLFRSSNLVLGNLETAVTTGNQKWPDKVFNYRTHPANLRCLSDAGINYVSLANNHTLDFCEDGLIDTINAVEEAGLKYAGGGRTPTEAAKPAVLHLGEEQEHEVHCYSFADHPSSWSKIKKFNLVDYGSKSREKIKAMLTTSDKRPALKLVSIHWGPNYSWAPGKEIRRMARFLIDECGVDVIHGHSSHHIQGVEIYKGKLIVYGCGDFVDDYAVSQSHRNDLSAAWRVTVGEDDNKEQGAVPRLKVQKLEVFPNRIKHFQAHILQTHHDDHEWVRNKFEELCGDMGTRVERSLGEDGQMVVNVD